jgi:hypothetical protein
MPACSARRKQHKRLGRLQQRWSDGAAKPTATELLQKWQSEARRARDLGAPAVWDLTRYPSVLATAHAVDPSGELLSELHRVCAEAVAEVAGRHLLGGSRPLADRRRRVKAVKRVKEKPLGKEVVGKSLAGMPEGHPRGRLVDAVCGLLCRRERGSITPGVYFV